MDFKRYEYRRGAPPVGLIEDYQKYIEPRLFDGAQPARTQPQATIVVCPPGSADIPQEAGRDPGTVVVDDDEIQALAHLYPPVPVINATIVRKYLWELIVQSARYERCPVELRNPYDVSRAVDVLAGAGYDIRITLVTERMRGGVAAADDHGPTATRAASEQKRRAAAQ